MNKFIVAALLLLMPSFANAADVSPIFQRDTVGGNVQVWNGTSYITICTIAGSACAPNIPNNFVTGSMLATGAAAANLTIGAGNNNVYQTGGSGTGFWGKLGSVANAGSLVTNGSGSVVASAGCIPIEAYGGKGDGSTDNLAAWNAEIAAFGTSNICVSFGQGTYNFSNAAAATAGTTSSISLQGVGRGVTRTVFTGNTDGFVFNIANQQAVQISNLSVLTSLVNSNDAVTVNSGDCTGSKQSSDFTNVTYSGTGSYPFTNRWSRALTLNGLSFINVTNNDFVGDALSGMQGIAWAGNTSGGCVALNLLISKSLFDNIANGVIMGTLAQGLFIAQSNFVNGAVAVNIPAGGDQIDQINISDSSINVTDDAIVTLSPFQGMFVNHNTIIVAAGKAGVHVNGGGNHIVISDNTIFGPGLSVGVGVEIDSAATLGVITGNVYSRLDAANSLSALSSGWNVQSNVYATTVTTPNLNAAGAANTIGGGSP